jgi:hypothetical protein
MAREAARPLRRCGGARAGGFATVELHHHKGRDLIMRSPKHEAHVEFMQSEDCVSSRRRTPRYVASNGFTRCGHLVAGANVPSTYLLLEIDPEEIVKNRSALLAVRRLSLVAPGSIKLVDYSEVRPRLSRRIPHRILALYNVREHVPRETEKCRIGITRDVIDTREFLSRATGRTELVTGSQAPKPPIELLERAKTILALHNLADAAAATWAIWAVLPARSPEKAKLGDLIAEHSRTHSDKLFQEDLPGERLARFCLEHGVSL